MDVDPLADAPPARYNYESDDEEDEFRPQASPSRTSEPPLPIDVKGDIQQGHALLIASGDLGRYWASGADLGEQTAAVFVGGKQIGLVFTPDWMNSTTVLISEALARIPLRAMYPYASAVLEKAKPHRLVLIDTYPTPTYATDTPTAFHDAPIRYLTTGEVPAMLKNGTAPFAPPNLLQSTSAAFLSLASLPPAPSSNPSSTTAPTSSSTVLLLPSPHVPLPPPAQVTPSNATLLSHDNDDALAQRFPTARVAQAQALALQLLGVQAGEGRVWAPKVRKGQAGTDGMAKVKGRSEIGEGGMYI